jgi:nitrate reductase NapE component
MTEAPEKPAEVAAPKEPDKSAAKEARTRGQRSLFIMVMLMFLVSIVVFVVGSYFFIIPHVVTHDLEIRHLQSKVGAFEDALLAPDEATAEEGTPEEAAPAEAAPAAPKAPEVKPAEPKKAK